MRKRRDLRCRRHNTSQHHLSVYMRARQLHHNIHLAHTTPPTASPSTSVHATATSGTPSQHPTSRGHHCPVDFQSSTTRHSLHTPGPGLSVSSSSQRPLGSRDVTRQVPGGLSSALAAALRHAHARLSSPPCSVHGTGGAGGAGEAGGGAARIWLPPPDNSAITAAAEAPGCGGALRQDSRGDYKDTRPTGPLGRARNNRATTHYTERSTDTHRWQSNRWLGLATHVPGSGAERTTRVPHTARRHTNTHTLCLCVCPSHSDTLTHAHTHTHTHIHVSTLTPLPHIRTPRSLQGATHASPQPRRPTPRQTSVGIDGSNKTEENITIEKCSDRCGKNYLEGLVQGGGEEGEQEREEEEEEEEEEEDDDDERVMSALANHARTLLRFFSP
ncbi:hypothetical protein E2C01_066180 [Portunus trituberculatus]|uniref:Uncharacterized protein n=1 Tax=Portunus trituberculatus TaxID=210409 RepID=A0A5B7HHJ6_PORTR|nr:hypothetical protein [Portunus trituberculatus]